MTGSEIIFYFLATVATLMALGVVLARNPIHSALFLVIAFLNVAGIFVLLGAEFLAAVQVIVYTGAILVLFLFVIMLVRPEDLAELGQGGRIQTVLAWLLGAALLAEIATVIVTGIVQGQRGAIDAQAVAQVGGNTQALGRFLYSEYLLPFEAASLVLLVATISAIVLGLPERVTNAIGRRHTGTISLAHSAGGDHARLADEAGVPAVDAPDLGEPGTIDVNDEPAITGGGATGRDERPGVKTVVRE